MLHKTKQDYFSSKSCGVPALGVLRNTVGLHVFLSPTPPSTLQYGRRLWLAHPRSSVKWKHMANMSCCFSIAMSWSRSIIYEMEQIITTMSIKVQQCQDMHHIVQHEQHQISHVLQQLGHATYCESQQECKTIQNHWLAKSTIE